MRQPQWVEARLRRGQKRRLEMNKTCTKCGQEKVIDLFSRSKSHAGGYSTWCKDCHKARRSETQSKYYGKKAEWRAKNADRYAKFLNEYRQRDDQKAKANARRKRWVDENRGRASSLWASMKEARRKATMQWSDFGVINFLYATRLYMTRETGEEWHVDHVVPVKGANVSGLHVHQNLRLVPAKFNLSKSNKF